MPGRASGARRSFSRRWLIDTATSLWTPVAFFAVAFVGYLFAVELWPRTAYWALPGMRGISVLALVAVPVLAIVRSRLPGFADAREARIEAREVARGMRHVPGAADALLELVERGSAAEVRARTQEAAQAAGPATPLGGAIVAIVLKAFLIAALVRGALVEPYRIPTGSMLPTLQVGDQVLVNRFVYGVQIPFTQWVPFPFVRRPAPGDLIVFTEPVTNDEVFIKRVVGTPGDEVEIVDGVVHLNGTPQQHVGSGVSLVVHEHRGGRWVSSSGQWLEELLDGTPHAIFRRRPAMGQRQGPWTVPEGSVFVLGDDRDASADSRYGFGKRRSVAFVPYGNIKGKAMVIWLSLSYEGMFSNLFGGTGFRADRLFLPVR